jgi:hypothetical protein
MYYLKHEHAEARTAGVLNALKNDASYEFIGEIILKINVV